MHYLNVLRSGALLIVSLLMLTGCLSEGDNPNSITESSDSPSDELIEIRGVAMKGVIRNGMVSASGKQYSAATAFSTLVTPSRTDENGEFAFLISSSLTQGSGILFELSADSATEMVCDVSEGCRFSGTNRIASFGEPFFPGNNLTLASFVPADEAEPVYLTPLSTLAVELAKRQRSGLTDAGFNTAVATVESWFGIREGAMTIRPVSLTDPMATDVSQPALELALINAAFLSLAADSRWDTVGDVLSAALNAIQSSGELPASGGESGVALSRELLLLTASLEASALADRSAFAIVNSTLADAADSLTQRSMELAEPETVPAPTPTPEPEPAPEPAPVPAPEPLPEPTPTPEPEPTPEPAPVPGTATLSWNAPLTRVNGESLAMGELEGYQIRYGQTNNVAAMTNNVEISSASTMEFTIDGLGEGLWYFAVRVVDVGGRFSGWSSVVSKEI